MLKDLNKKNICKIVIIGLLFALLIFAVYKFKIIHTVNIYAKNFIVSFGHLSAIIYIMIFWLRTLLIVLPTSVFVVLAGNLFGPLYGTIYSTIAIFLSASTAFFISKNLGRGFVIKILGEKINKINLKIENNGFKIIMIMRLLLVFPFDLLSYGAGLTKIKYKDFVFGSIIGVFPELVSLNLLGANISDPYSIKFLSSLILVIITIFLPKIIDKVKKNKRK